jgi:hypothetical protein
MSWSRGAIVAGSVLVVLALTALIVAFSTNGERRTGATASDVPPPGTSAGPAGSTSPTTGPSATASPVASASPTRRSTSPPARSGGRPGPNNTGVPAGVQLRVVSGDQVFTKANQVISGLDIRGYVRIRANGVTLKNSIVRGGAPRCNAAVIFVERGYSATIQDTEVNPTQPNACLDGIWAEDSTLLRLDIQRVVDGVKAFDGVTLKDSYIHNLSRFASDPNQGGGPTHNDAVQTYEGNQNIWIVHNNLALTSEDNAAYQVTQDGGKVAKGLHIVDNWLDGGGCTLNFSHKGGPAMSGIEVVNNRFGRNMFYANCAILISNSTSLSKNSGNVFADNGKPIPPPDQHN